MVSRQDANKARQKRHTRVRGKVSGTVDCPRLNVYRSLSNIYVQLIDDVAGVTLAQASTVEKDFAGYGGNVEAAKAVGKTLAERAKERALKNAYLTAAVTSITVVLLLLQTVPVKADLSSNEGGKYFMAKIDVSSMELEERVVTINRVSKTVKGGRIFKFSALVVVGDGNGLVGFGVGKSGEVPDAIRKGIEDAKKNVIKVALRGTTIPHEITGKFGAGEVLLMPAPKGTGVIAGGPVRAVVETVGIGDIRTKAIRSNNPYNVVRATINGLSQLRTAEEVAAIRGKSVKKILG